jgi:hypothetical protein
MTPKLSDLDHLPISDWDDNADRAAIDELEDMLRQARDRAHWLAVHRRMKLARHIENQVEASLKLAYDLRGRHARKEPT